MEEWRDIKGYEGYYQISNIGRIKSLMYRGLKRKTPKIIKWRVASNGYAQVILSVNNIQRRYSVHRLVALHFIPNLDNKPCINHKDENPLNNNMENLEWCTYSYNTNYGNCIEKIRKGNIGKVGSYPVIQQSLTGDFIAEYSSIGEASRATGISYTMINDCCRGFKKDYKNNKIYPCLQARGYKFKFNKNNGN